MDERLLHIKRVRKDAAMTFLHAFTEGRPFDELRTELPKELEAAGQDEAALIVRSFFNLPRLRAVRWPSLPLTAG